MESDEDCDCGRDSDGERVENNPCCNCGNCTLPMNISCSPSQGPCCNDQCQYLNDSTVCQPQSECSDESRCKYPLSCIRVLNNNITLHVCVCVCVYVCVCT